MSELVFDVCYFDTYSEHKIVMSSGIPTIEEALLIWKRAERELSTDTTLKPYILPRRC